MNTPVINQHVLMSSAAHFSNDQAINPYMDHDLIVDRALAQTEHDRIRDALIQAGVSVTTVEAPANCQDGVYTANWALIRGKTAIMSRLPNARKGEEAYAKKVLAAYGFTTIDAPENLRFSGQGDALACGNYLFMGHGYRTDQAAHQFVADTLGYDVISLQTIPQLDINSAPVINQDSGWPDSFYYDIDLALSIISPTCIAWCPEAFTPESQALMRLVTDIDKIEVSVTEAQEAFACNLVSTGKTVVMSDRAPQLRAALEARGLTILTPQISELLKGGGYIRCTTLTLSNS